ncbi:MAG: SDR family oxidoreductase [Balneolaceae bacterium]
MKITVVGAHGQVAMLLHPMMMKRGHEIRGIIRKNEQAEELRKNGVEPVVADIENMTDISDPVGKVDAVVFAAGAGPGSGSERKWDVDRDGAIKLIEAAQKNGIKRYIMISAMGLDEPRGDKVFQDYQKAKAEADEALIYSGLDYTILRPGRLTDDAGTGLVAIEENLPPGEVPREDVAAVIAEILELPETTGYQFDLTGGNMPIREALKNATATSAGKS